MEPTPAVVTPNYASFGRRLGAYFIDYIIVLNIVLIIIFSVGFASVGPTMLSQMQSISQSTQANASEMTQAQIAQFTSFYIQFLGTFFILWLVCMTTFIVYYVGLTASRGQTLGKMALGIKVVKVDGSKVTIGTALMREVLGKFVSGIILGIGYLFPLWDSQKQALHDKIANTLVVKI